jgi:hypothetical protein
MDSSASTKQAEPHDSSQGLSTQEAELVARADERLAHAYEQIAHADEQLARINEQIYRLEHEAVRTKSVNRVHGPSRGRPAMRGLVGLLLMAGICIAAFVSQSYGNTARQVISRWVPQLVPASSSPVDTPQLAAQQNAPAVQLAAADTALAQPPAQAAPQEAAAAPIPPEVTQLLQTMARDLASVQEGIQQLKTSQEEITRENARTAEQLKASQEQMARVVASVSELNQRSRAAATTPANRPAPTAAATARPAAAPQTQARAQARAPTRQQ